MTKAVCVFQCQHPSTRSYFVLALSHVLSFYFNHIMLQDSSSPKRTMRAIHLPNDYSSGIQLGLVAVSASRSRPYLQAAGGGSGRQTAACLLVSFGLGLMDGPSHGVPAGVVRARDRNPDGPRPAVAGLGSAGRLSLTSQRSVYRGLGPGRGPFGRGAPNKTNTWDRQSQRANRLVTAIPARLM